MILKETIGNVHIEIDDSRLMNNFSKAQTKLDMQVLADSNEYVPFQQGYLRSSGHIVEPGLIQWDGPYAHYQYIGEVYGPSYPVKDNEGNIIGWWSPPQKYPTGRDLQYKTPGTGAFWFEEAKDTHVNQWIELVRNEVKK